MVDAGSKHKGCSIIFVNDQNKVLLFLRDDKPGLPFPGRWDILGGHVEEGETPDQCIKREMQEEIGLDLDDFSLFRVYDFIDRTEYAFWKKIDLDIDRIQLTEGQCLKWFSAEKAEQTDLAYGSNRILRDFFKKNFYNSAKR
ncbi:MAG: NUDIX domain-containing protein [Desulfobacteraceae bacterium]|nr:MAG: NUDIX domain-containing protein [Desulfobacteraceae bacterium]